MPQAQTNIWSLPSRVSQVMAVAIGKPIRKAGGAIRAKQKMSRKRVWARADRVEHRCKEQAVADQQRGDRHQDQRQSDPGAVEQRSLSSAPRPENTSMPAIITEAEMVGLVSAKVKREISPTSTMM